MREAKNTPEGAALGGEPGNLGEAGQVSVQSRLTAKRSRINEFGYVVALLLSLLVPPADVQAQAEQVVLAKEGWPDSDNMTINQPSAVEVIIKLAPAAAHPDSAEYRW